MKANWKIGMIMAFAAGFLLSCGKEVVPEKEVAVPVYESGIVVLPEIFHARPLTKTSDDDASVNKGDKVDARDELRENFVGTLDLFVKVDGEDSWFRQYHLKAGGNNGAGDPWIVDEGVYGGTSLRNATEQLLAQNWAEDGYIPGVKYCIYACANNEHTSNTSDPDYPSTPAKLLELKTYEANIYRYYKDETVEYWESHMKKKKVFLMDGYLEWEVDPDKTKQVWDITLRRAAAKIIVNIRYSDEKVMDLVSEDGTRALVNGVDVAVEKNVSFTPDQGSIKEYLDYVNRVPGDPRWKFVHFSFQASDVATEPPYYPSLEVEGEGMPLQTYPYNFTPEKVDDEAPNLESTYHLVCYSYPTQWGVQTDMAPYILFSVAYTDKVNSSDYKVNYYRIPVCNESEVTSLDRNNIYLVDVEIASLGSSNSPLQMEDEQLRVEYHVIPWTEEDIDQRGTTTVIAGDTKYFMVSPTTYTLKGDDVQTVELNWYASVSVDDGRFVDIDASSVVVTYSNYQGMDVDIKGTVTKTPASPDGTGDIVLVSTAPGKSGGANGETVSITLTPEGLIRVSSQALDSRAVKQIQFKVKLRGTSFEETVTIHHFPLDNIQNIEGWYSTKTTTTTMTVENTVYNPVSPGSGWTNAGTVVYSGNSSSDSGRPSSENWTLETSTSYGYNDSPGNGWTLETNNIWLYNSTHSGWTRYTSNSSFSGAADRGGWGPRYYIWYRWYRWTNTAWTKTESQTITFVDWQETPDGTMVIGRDDCLHPKVYNESDGRIYEIVDSDLVSLIEDDIRAIDKRTRNNNYYAYYSIDGYWYYHTYQRINAYSTRYGEYPNPYSDTDFNLNAPGWDYYSTSSADASYYEEGTLDYFGYLDSKGTIRSGYTNNHMYVLQITSTSDKYALGRPVLDSTTHMSGDQVVSPAFMTASQLGGMSTIGGMNATKAAKHCHEYVEVALDGTRYTGWRLPTKGEVQFILDYQYAEATQPTIAEVLAAHYYYTLDGGVGENTYEERTGSNGTFARCVRDLSLEEIKKLNGE